MRIEPDYCVSDWTTAAGELRGRIIRRQARPAVNAGRTIRQFLRTRIPAIGPQPQPSRRIASRQPRGRELKASAAPTRRAKRRAQTALDDDDAVDDGFPGVDAGIISPAFARQEGDRVLCTVTANAQRATVAESDRP